MKAFSRPQNLFESVKSFLEGIPEPARTLWNQNGRPTMNPFQPVNGGPTKLAGANVGLFWQIWDDSAPDETLLRSGALLQLDLITRKERVMHAFLRGFLNEQLGFEGKAVYDGFIPFKNFWDVPNSPTTEDQILVRFLPGTGWTELLPGQAGSNGSPILDPSAVHYYATFTLHY